MTTPTVHLNGTGRDELLAGFEAAYRAVGDAITTLVNTAPNARDYYVQGPSAFKSAVAEYQSRIDRLRSVKTELLDLHQSVDVDNIGWHDENLPG